MAQYIDKDALVAEVEERIETYNKGYAIGDDRRADALEVLLHDINTLEVKEVDLEEEIDNWYNTVGVPVTTDALKETAKYFFELGLNAQQNIHIDITSIDKVIKENGIDPNSKEAKIFKESYYIALEKLKARKGE